MNKKELEKIVEEKEKELEEEINFDIINIKELLEEANKNEELEGEVAELEETLDILTQDYVVVHHIDEDEDDDRFATVLRNIEQTGFDVYKNGNVAEVFDPSY